MLVYRFVSIAKTLCNYQEKVGEIIMLYANEWIAIAVLAFIGAFCLNLVLRGSGPARARLPGKLRYIFVTMVMVFFLLPAPVPNYPGVYAPAFVVFVFESVFQSNGQANESQGILVLGLGGGSIIGLLALVVFRSKNNRGTDKVAAD